MALQQPYHDKFLVFEDRIQQSIDEKRPILHSKHEPWLWPSRFVFIQGEQDDKLWYVIAYDLLMNESRPISYPKTNDQLFRRATIASLSNDVSIIFEGSSQLYWIHFVRFDWGNGSFQLIKKFERQCEDCFVFVDQMNPSRFILKWAKNSNWKHQSCKFLKGKIEFEEDIVEMRFSFHFYSKERLIRIQNFPQTQAIVYDLSSKKQEIFEIDRSSMPENTDLGNTYKWFNDRLYSDVRFRNENKCGIAWSDLKNKKWMLIDFETKSKTLEFKFVDENLNVFMRNKSEENEMLKSEVKIYSIPMRRPNLLRYSVWLLVVKIMKNNAEKDPYEEAREYLPLNSDLRALWFKNEEKMEIN